MTDPKASLDAAIEDMRTLLQFIELGVFPGMRDKDVQTLKGYIKAAISRLNNARDDAMAQVTQAERERIRADALAEARTYFDGKLKKVILNQERSLYEKILDSHIGDNDE